MSAFLKKLLLGAALLGSTLAVQAAGPLKVAVTDLAYEERVQEYFRSIKASEKSSLRATGRESERESDYSYSRRSSGSVNARSESSFSYEEGTYSYIDRGELRKFTADIKGEMLKSGYFKLSQAKPFTAKNSEKLYDVIARIKQGMYPGADYVLFGSINSIEFRQEANPIDNTDTVSHTLSLELVGEFSLISTKNYQVKASFSAMGEGQDTKLMSSRGGRVVLNRGKVMSEVSKSLGVDVIKQLEEQLAALSGDYPVRETVIEREQQKEEVIIFR
ncbi:hypothetical protein [Azovibrio restrictus]|uniref:hypothetical protein n=1 Tax=Azovibrio restrictus TaxID=146938 RepID=UPI0026F2CB6A|nr:hypothetical protein [Azovibrio restrictus]MDD3482340.1 hypothetical protein [Azovibrio restrictus]